MLGSASSCSSRRARAGMAVDPAASKRQGRRAYVGGGRAAALTTSGAILSAAARAGLSARRRSRRNQTMTLLFLAGAARAPSPGVPFMRAAARRRSAGGPAHLHVTLTDALTRQGGRGYSVGAGSPCVLLRSERVGCRSGFASCSCAQERGASCRRKERLPHLLPWPLHGADTSFRRGQAPIHAIGATLLAILDQ